MISKNTLFGFSLGLGLGLGAIHPATATDTILTEPEPIEAVRVCDTFGEGYFYIPGSKTCMRLSGYLRAVIGGGDNAYAQKKSELKRDTYSWLARSTLRFHTATETDLGTIRSYIELRSQWADGFDGQTSALRFGYIELGGLRVGLDESIFNHWTGYFGNMYNDDINDPTGYSRTNVISYVHKFNDRNSAILGLEQGTDEGIAHDRTFRLNSQGNPYHQSISGQTDDYAPNVLLGLKTEQDSWKLAAIGAYDAYYGEWAGKIRLDVTLSDQLKLWVMGGYKSGKDYYALDDHYNKNNGAIDRKGRLRIYRATSTLYGNWGGDWALWGGGTYQFTPKASLNVQLDADDSKTFVAGMNITYEVTPGLIVVPEVSYASWNDNYGGRNGRNDTLYRTSLKGEHAVQGTLQIQRNF